MINFCKRVATAIKFRLWLLERRISKRRSRSAIYRSARPSDVFIVGFPKSGSTWLRFMLGQALKEPRDRPLTFAGLLDIVPDINDQYFDAKPLMGKYEGMRDPRFFSLHAPYDSRFRRVVYVARDPRDVMVSFWHFTRLGNPRFETSLEDFVLSDVQWPCRWDTHVDGWLLDHKHPDLLLIKYEDLHRDPHATLKGLLQFAGLDIPEERIGWAVENSTFAKMREAEDAGEREFWGKGHPEERFVRKGRVGGGAAELDAQAKLRLEEKFRSTMSRLGYLDSSAPTSVDAPRASS